MDMKFVNDGENQYWVCTVTGEKRGYIDIDELSDEFEFSPIYVDVVIMTHDAESLSQISHFMTNLNEKRAKELDAQCKEAMDKMQASGFP